MAAAFGSGALFALVSGFSGGNALQGAFSTGVCFALFQGAFYKLSKKFGAPKKGDLQYSRASHLMTTLGFPVRFLILLRCKHRYTMLTVILCTGVREKSAKGSADR